MPFIGNQPAEKYSSFQKQDFTTSATTSYTLDHPVANGNEIALFINFVRQEPTAAYTASGTSLTLTSATTSSDDMYCVYLGKAVQTVNPPSGSVGASQLASDAVTAAKLNDDIISGQTALASEPADTDEFLVSDAGTLKRIDYSLIKGGGITEADMWRLTADVGSPSGFLTSNWERVDTNGQGNLGTGMSESSGVFTFPSTGFYLVTAMGNIKFTGGAHDQGDFTIYTTTDNSTYNRASRANESSATTNYHGSTCAQILFDVTSTSTHKVKFYSAGNWTVKGDTNDNESHVSFLKLGDT